MLIKELDWWQKTDAKSTSSRQFTEEQPEQVIPFLTKKLWFEVGLDSSLEECLDDLIRYANKRKRGERIKDAILHDAILQSLDMTVSKLTGSNLDPLFDK